jgi:hypothetical protein
MDRDQIMQLAEIRGQHAVLCRVGGSDCWLMADESHNTLDKLAEFLDSDSWDLWTAGLLAAYDKNGDLMYDTECQRDWETVSPVEFREMRWCVVAVTGMSRGRVIAEFRSRTSAETKCTKGMHSAQVRFLPLGSKGIEVSL